MPASETAAASQAYRKQSAVIQAYVKTLPRAPGVYRMLDKDEKILYIGKAQSLAVRVRNYVQYAKLPLRLQRMVSLTVTMEFITTETASDALILEANMIKKHQPPFNVLLKDVKSFSNIAITNHPFPRVEKHRGKQQAKDTYYGPFTSMMAVQEALKTLHKVFQLRNCRDHDFNTRTRPCLQYHIKQCSAPCVGLITQEAYGETVKMAHGFMEGDHEKILSMLQTRMQEAAQAQQYEEAALYRDRITRLSQLDHRHNRNMRHISHGDIIGIETRDHTSCIQVFGIRHHQNYGSQAFFMTHEPGAKPEDILACFLPQFYTKQSLPKTILLSRAPTDFPLILTALKSLATAPLTISVPQKGPGKALVDEALSNAQGALQRRALQSLSQQKYREEIQRYFSLEKTPEYIEVYDNSHLQGTNALGAMIVTGPDGFEKNRYRQFNMPKEGQLEKGDDYAMMAYMIRRRFQNHEGELPDLLLIDGGEGQLSSVTKTLKELNLVIPVIAISKGVDRHAGREFFHTVDAAPRQLAPQDPCLHYLQRLRDEAHRFGITGHRKRRSKAMVKSALDSIPGVGPKRKKALLLHFGSPDRIKLASVNELLKVPGINDALATTILGYLRE